MTGPLPVRGDRPILRAEELLETFRAGAKPESEWGVGLEWERLGVEAETARAIPYEGERGVAAILRRLASEAGWEAENEKERIIGLQRGSGDGPPERVSLEPGGQVELSGRIHRDLRDLRGEVAAFLRESSAAAGPLGVAWLPLGLHPFTPIESIPWVPKERYSIMAPYLGARGSLAHHMMKGTAGVQINFDYEDEADAAEKMSAAVRLTTIVTAAVANSPAERGRLTGLRTGRSRVWLDTDPARCGLLPDAIRDGFSFRSYLEYALDVPVIFVVRDERWLPLDGIPFRKFIREGYRGLSARLSDWTLHLTTIFTEVRLKTYLEVRGADSVPADLAVALAALWKGILYDASARRRALSLVAGLGLEDHLAFQRQVCALGTEARLGDATAGDLALELCRTAREGLVRLAGRETASKAASPARPGEEALLDPLIASLENGGCPAARLAARWEEEIATRPAALVEWARGEERSFLSRVESS